VAYPSQLFGALVTEKVRALGAGLFNTNGEAFVHPLETRDVVSAAIMRECGERKKGIAVSGDMNTVRGDMNGINSDMNGANGTRTATGVWLDSPNIDLLHGEGHIEKNLPGMLRMFMNYGIDMRKTPILVYPTLHYQNGGIEIEPDGSTPKIPNLYVAGETVGGIHGRNRLMGNSLLDVIVFGRNAGHTAGGIFAGAKPGRATLLHVERFERERAAAGILDETPSPMLLPDYTGR
jgi:succinate dehydrogenase / fumarate reductase flavoprotein subunit